MKKRAEEPDREDRIRDEAIVDAHGPEEQAIGWYYYLADKLYFPFKAKCKRERAISPLQVGERVKVVGMGPAEECEREMFAEVRWQDRTLTVPLSQIWPVEADEDTKEAVGDWHYWVERGYEF